MQLKKVESEAAIKLWMKKEKKLLARVAAVANLELPSNFCSFLSSRFQNNVDFNVKKTQEMIVGWAFQLKKSRSRQELQLFN